MDISMAYLPGGHYRSFWTGTTWSSHCNPFQDRVPTRRWNLRVPDLQITCSVSTGSYGSRILVQIVTTRRYSLFQYLAAPGGWEWHINILLNIELTIFERDMWCGFSGYRRTEVNPALGHMYIVAMISLVSWNKERYKIMMCFFTADNKETTRLLTSRADSRLAPRQWKTSLQCNAVSHWLGANLESALDLPISLTHITLYIYIYIYTNITSCIVVTVESAWWSVMTWRLFETKTSATTEVSRSALIWSATAWC